MTTSRLFGTDGIRGEAGRPPLDPATVFRLGDALVDLGKRKVVIGRDTRESGLWVETALSRAVTARGGSVALAGVVTTPGISYLARSGDFDGGVMISASHNPFHYNGLKVFSRSGVKISDQQERRLEELIANCKAVPKDLHDWPAERSQVEFSNPEMTGRYAEFLKSSVANGALKSLKVALDCANGAAFSIAPQVFRSLGADVVALFNRPNGRDINESCGALHPGQLAQAVVRHGAAFGVAFDGDADRAIFADESGNVVDGDFVLYVLARHYRRTGLLNSGGVVTTVMANIGLEIALQREKIQLVRTQVGDRHVLKEMLRGGHEIGGEQSGHTIILRRSPAGDGIQTALQIAEIISREGKSMAELCAGLEKFPQVLLNVTVKEKPDFSRIPLIQGRIDEAAAALQGRGRVLIRYSGTEPLARVMVEGDRKEEIASWAQSIADSFQQALG